MKILVTSIIDPKKGAPSRLHWFIRYLSREHDVTVVSINDWWKAKGQASPVYMRGFDFGKYQLHYLTGKKQSPIIQEISSALPGKGWLRKLARSGFDVHFNYNSLFLGYTVGKLMRSQKIGTVYDMADDLPKMIGNSPQIPAPLRGTGRLAGRMMLRKNLDLAEKVCYITPNLRDMYPVPQNKTVLIPNGVNIDFFKPHNVELLKKELGLENSIVIGYVGALREWVDLDPIFGAIKQLSGGHPNLKMLVVGGEVGLPKARELARTYGIQDKVIFTDTVPYVRVPDYTCCMDICVMPLKFDNAQPLSFLQYLACAKPSIATRPLVAPPEVVLYASGADKCAEVIERLINNPAEREEMGRRGRNFVEKNYNWDVLSEKLERVLLEVSKRRPV